MAGVAPEEKQTDRKHEADDYDVNPGVIAFPRGQGFGRLGPFQSFRRQLESPGDDERDRKAEREQHDDEPDRPIGNLEKRKDLRGDLDEQPRDHGVGDCNLVNAPAFQFREKIPHPLSGRSSLAPALPGLL